jgi:putative transposase
VSAEIKLELLGLIDDAASGGWSLVRACGVLGVSDDRVGRWRARLADVGSLVDRRLVGPAVHRLLAWEEQAVLDLIETWGLVDRSHRKLAHRGSYTGRVFVSPSTVLRVAAAHEVRLAGESYRSRPLRSPFPAVAWEPNRIWVWDATHFRRARRVAYAIVDVVTRYWIGYLVSVEQTATQAQLLFTGALESQRLLRADGSAQTETRDGPILVACSDNGSEMRAADTRQFMAWMTIAQHFGRPGTPTDQAHVESFFSHLKGEWPHLLAIGDPLVLASIHRVAGRVPSGPEV